MAGAYAKMSSKLDLFLHEVEALFETGKITQVLHDELKSAAERLKMP